MNPEDVDYNYDNVQDDQYKYNYNQVNFEYDNAPYCNRNILLNFYIAEYNMNQSEGGNSEYSDTFNKEDDLTHVEKKYKVEQINLEDY
jgi:hypothetical protein